MPDLIFFHFFWDRPSVFLAQCFLRKHIFCFLQRLLNLITIVLKKKHDKRKLQWSCISRVSCIGWKPKSLSSYVDKIFSFLYSLPDERMIDRTNAIKTSWILLQVRLREESKTDVCEPIGNLIENDYRQTGHICTPYEYRGTADISQYIANEDVTIYQHQVENNVSFLLWIHHVSLFDTYSESRV